jgi:hypothetical protein
VEDVGDLLADLEQALEGMPGHAARGSARGPARSRDTIGSASS